MGEATQLVRQFQAEWPSARVAVDEFPSGAFYLDVVCAGRHFLLRYFPEDGSYGVDEVLPDTGSPHRPGFTLDLPQRSAEGVALLRQAAVADD